MPYFAIDDHWWAHDKTVQMSDGAQALWARAGSWAAGQLTDGYIPDHVLPLLRAKPRHVSELNKLNLWTKTDGGHTFQGWSEHQQTKSDVENMRKANRERQRRYRAAKAESNGVSNGVTDGVTNGVSHTNAGHVSHATQTQPNPTQPNPLLKERAAQAQPTPAPAEAGEQPKKPTKRGTRLPDDWMPTPDLIDAMSTENPHVELRWETTKFRDYWHAQPGAKGVKADWDATWRNWIRRAAEHATPQQRAPSASQRRVDNAIALGQRVATHPPRPTLKELF
jgi:hypothetical protein